MTHIQTIAITRLFNTGNYEHEKITIEVDIERNAENPTDAAKVLEDLRVAMDGLKPLSHKFGDREKILEEIAEWKAKHDSGETSDDPFGPDPERIIHDRTKRLAFIDAEIAARQNAMETIQRLHGSI